MTRRHFFILIDGTTPTRLFCHVFICTLFPVPLQNAVVLPIDLSGLSLHGKLANLLSDNSTLRQILTSPQKIFQNTRFFPYKNMFFPKMKNRFFRQAQRPLTVFFLFESARNNPLSAEPTFLLIFIYTVLYAEVGKTYIRNVMCRHAFLGGTALSTNQPFIGK